MPKRVSLTDQLERLATERVPHEREAFIAEILNYAETDLLCYRVALTEKLRPRQDALFDPILEVLNKTYGIALQVTDALAPIAQPEASLNALKTLLDASNDRELSALFVLTPLLGSALLAAAVWKGLTSLETALDAATLDERAQAEQWGEDEAEATARKARGKDAQICHRFLIGN